MQDSLLSKLPLYVKPPQPDIFLSSKKLTARISHPLFHERNCKAGQYFREQLRPKGIYGLRDVRLTIRRLI